MSHSMQMTPQKYAPTNSAWSLRNGTTAILTRCSRSRSSSQWVALLLRSSNALSKPQTIQNTPKLRICANMASPMYFRWFRPAPTQFSSGCSQKRRREWNFLIARQMMIQLGTHFTQRKDWPRCSEGRLRWTNITPSSFARPTNCA